MSTAPRQVPASGPYVMRAMRWRVPRVRNPCRWCPHPPDRLNRVVERETGPGAGVRGAMSEVVVRLREQILAGEYPVGVGLPSEAELAALHGVSRRAIRTALAALARQG